MIYIVKAFKQAWNEWVEIDNNPFATELVAIQYAKKHAQETGEYVNVLSVETKSIWTNWEEH
jgi:hypothetical protein